ncbi:MAG: aminotransferase class V-fold PLP-dependent enzyme [Candidatus Caldatribacteriaceae bacterium]
MGTREVFQGLLGTEKDVLPFPLPAFWGWEAILVNAFSPQDKVVCIVTGERSERWARMAEILGLSVVRLGGRGYETPTAQDLNLLLLTDAGKHIRGILAVHVEERSGAWVDLEALGEVCHERGLFFAVDVSNSLGIFPLALDRSFIDAAVARIQDTPELSLLVLGKNIRERASGSRFLRYSLAVENVEEAFGEYPVPSSLLERFETLYRRGIENVWRRRLYLARVFRRGARALRCVVGGEEMAFPSVSLLVLPSGVKREWVIAFLRKEGVVAGEVPERKDALFVCHGESLSVSEIVEILFLLGKALEESGQKVDIASVFSHLWEVKESG